MVYDPWMLSFRNSLTLYSASDWLLTADNPPSITGTLSPSICYLALFSYTTWLFHPTPTPYVHNLLYINFRRKGLPIERWWSSWAPAICNVPDSWWASASSVLSQNSIGKIYLTVFLLCRFLSTRFIKCFPIPAAQFDKSYTLQACLPVTCFHI